MGLRIMELTGDVNPSMEALNRADILIVTPEVTPPGPLQQLLVHHSYPVSLCRCLLSLSIITDYLSIYLSIPHSPINQL